MTEQILEQVQKGISLDELNQLEADFPNYKFEVEYGEIRKWERDMTFFHVLVIQNLFRLLDAYVNQHNLGYVFIDGARYILAATEKHIQRAYVPDLSFLKKERLPVDFEWSGYFMGAPDLAVEVASPNQSVPQLIRHIGYYLEARTSEAWLILPHRQEVQQYRQDDVLSYHAHDTMDTNLLFQGLELKVADLFTKPNR